MSRAATHSSLSVWASSLTICDAFSTVIGLGSAWGTFGRAIWSTARFFVMLLCSSQRKNVLRADSVRASERLAAPAFRRALRKPLKSLISM